MKRLFACALTALLAVMLLAAPAYAALEAGTGSGFYAVDDAGVLSAQTEKQLAEYNAVLENECGGAQLVVATVSYLDEDADIYATRLMNSWGVGNDNGVLLLLVTEEYVGGLTVGSGLDDAFYDSFPEKYYDDFWDDVDADRFDEAVSTLAGHIYDWYLDYYDVSLTTEPEQAPSYPDNYGYGYSEPVRRGPSILGVVGMVLIFLVIVWVLGAASRFNRMRSWGYTGGFMPIFLPGGRRRYRTRWQQRPPAPPPPPGPGGPAGFGGPGGFMGGGFRSQSTRRSSFSSRPRSGGFGGSSRPSGTSRPSGGSFRGGGFGGHSGGGFRGRK